MKAHAHDDLALARVRAEFDEWRSGRCGRGRIPDRLWLQAVSLLDSCSAAVVCKELQLSPAALRKHRRSLDASSSAFVELRAVDLAPTRSTRASRVEAVPSPIRTVLERGDGSRLTLELPTAIPVLFETVIAAFLRR
jgi:hypothetical protein